MIIIFDITEYYPNVISKDCNDSAKPVLTNQNSKEMATFIIEGSEISIKNSTVKYEDKLFKQKRGVPAGPRRRPNSKEARECRRMRTHRGRRQ